jgi:hypothetical protein
MWTARGSPGCPSLGLRRLLRDGVRRDLNRVPEVAEIGFYLIGMPSRVLEAVQQVHRNHPAWAALRDCRERR